jgi:hypothetical protein
MVFVLLHEARHDFALQVSMPILTDNAHTSVSRSYIKTFKAHSMATRNNANSSSKFDDSVVKEGRGPSRWIQIAVSGGDAFRGRCVGCADRTFGLAIELNLCTRGENRKGDCADTSPLPAFDSFLYQHRKCQQ